MSDIIAYHFTSNALRDGRPIPPVGKTLVHDGPLTICESGLHASMHPFDALYFAPGPLLHRVRMSGDIVFSDDKLAASGRTILASLDATDLLRAFARWCASRVVDLWDAPAVVRRYLATGDESLREAALEAACVSEAAAWEAWEAAAWAAVWAAVWAAWAEACASARAAASAAAWAEACAAACAEACAAACAEACAAQRAKFEEMVEAAFAEVESE